MKNMLAKSLELTQVTSQEANQAKRMMTLKKQYTSLEKYEKVVTKQEKLVRKFTIMDSMKSA